MDDSVYEGLAGIGIALSEAYDLVDSLRQKKIIACLKRNFFLLYLNSYSKIQNNILFRWEIRHLSTAIFRIGLIYRPRNSQAICQIL